MREGFYFHRNNIYYGVFDETQVSGQGKVCAVSPDHIRTSHPVCEEDRAVRLWDNHRLLEPEYEDLKTMLSRMEMFLHLSGTREAGLSGVEERLGLLTLPRELELIYGAIQGCPEYFTGAERFLPPEELYMEQGVLVFYKRKRTPVAGCHLESGRLAEYHKKEWTVERSGISCYQFCAGRIITLAMEGKAVFKQGRCKGKFVTTLNIQRELESFCNETYHLLPELNIYGIAVLYSEAGLIAWIRSNGFYADIHAGASDGAQLEALAEHLGNIIWRETT